MIDRNLIAATELRFARSVVKEERGDVNGVIVARTIKSGNWTRKT